MSPTKPNKSLTFHHPTTTKPEKKDKPLKQVFRGKEMAISGSFTNAGKAVSVEKIAKWITLHGGVFVSEVGSETTHLICDVEDYRRRRPQVTKARALGKKCKIVTFDWLEECLLRTNKRLAPTSEYTLPATIQRLQKRRHAEARLKKDFANDGDIDPVTDVRKGLHRVYFDWTAFEYKVELRRVDVVGGRRRVERYCLFLFQSIAQPYTYMTAAQLNETTITPNPPSPSNPTGKPTKTHRPTSYFREYCAPKEFHHAFADFKHFFHEKTGLEWDDRLEEEVEGRFRYVLPTEGRPLGVLPPGRKRRAVYPMLEREEVGMEWEVVDSGGIEGRSDGLEREIEEVDRMDTEVSTENDSSEHPTEEQNMGVTEMIDLTTEEEEEENPEPAQETKIIETTHTTEHPIQHQPREINEMIDLTTEEEEENPEPAQKTKIIKTPHTTEHPVQNQPQETNQTIDLTTEDHNPKTTQGTEHTDSDPEPFFDAQESQFATGELVENHEMIERKVVDLSTEDGNLEMEDFMEVEKDEGGRIVEAEVLVQDLGQDLSKTIKDKTAEYCDIPREMSGSREEPTKTTKNSEENIKPTTILENTESSDLAPKKGNNLNKEIQDPTYIPTRERSASREEPTETIHNTGHSIKLNTSIKHDNILVTKHSNPPPNQESQEINKLQDQTAEENTVIADEAMITEEWAYELSDDDEEEEDVEEDDEDEDMKDIEANDAESVGVRVGGIEGGVVEGLMCGN